MKKLCFYCKKLHETDSTGMSVCEECKKEKCRYCKKEPAQIHGICEKCCPCCNEDNDMKEPQKEWQDWEKELRNYFHVNADLQIVGEHWIEGMIKIMNGVLKAEIAKAKEERDEKLKKMIIKAINYHKKGFRHDGLENETLDECLLELLK